MIYLVIFTLSFTYSMLIYWLCGGEFVRGSQLATMVFTASSLSMVNVAIANIVKNFNNLE